MTTGKVNRPELRARVEPERSRSAASFLGYFSNLTPPLVSLVSRKTGRAEEGGEGGGGGGGGGRGEVARRLPGSHGKSRPNCHLEE